MGISNPLRLRTLSITKHVPPDVSSEYESNLVQLSDGSWRLKFSKEYFKNGDSLYEDYDAKLPDGLNTRITEYLSIYRPVLTARNPSSPWLFCTRLGAQHGSLSEEIDGIAQRFIPEVVRMRAHALRHIVATDFLTKNPGQYVMVAELLHDKLETVLKNYAHFKTDAAFSAHEQHLQNFFDGI
jgi:hypothetical protein